MADRLCMAGGAWESSPVYLLKISRHNPEVDADKGLGLEWLTERSSMLSRRCRGTTVTSSISHRKATSEGTRPNGRGKAMVSCVVTVVLLLKMLREA